MRFSALTTAVLLAAPSIAVPGISVIADQLRVSHEGSMWTGGLTIYF